MHLLYGILLRVVIIGLYLMLQKTNMLLQLAQKIKLKC